MVSICIQNKKKSPEISSSAEKNICEVMLLPNSVKYEQNSIYLNSQPSKKSFKFQTPECEQVLTVSNFQTRHF